MFSWWNETNRALLVVEILVLALFVICNQVQARLGWVPALGFLAVVALVVLVGYRITAAMRSMLTLAYQGLRENAKIILVAFLFFALVAALALLSNRAVLNAIAAVLQALLTSLLLLWLWMRSYRPEATVAAAAASENVFQETFESGLGKWRFKVKDSGARVIMGYQGSAYSLQMPYHTSERPEIAYVGGVDDFRNGLIECEVYLPAGTIFNVLFRGDMENDRYYGARLDTRVNWFDTLMRRDGSSTWFQLGGAHGGSTPGDSWHTFKLVVGEDRFTLYRDGQPVARWGDLAYESGQIGLMCELGPVAVSSFKVVKFPPGLHLGHW